MLFVGVNLACEIASILKQKRNVIAKKFFMMIKVIQPLKASEIDSSVTGNPRDLACSIWFQTKGTVLLIRSCWAWVSFWTTS
jgi:hypothetical protein